MSQHSHRQAAFDLQLPGLLKQAEKLRLQHPGCGVEKMYYLLKPDFIGRDRFIELMMDAGFRLKRPRNYRRTTYAGGVRYANLINGKELKAPSVVWQSDITYFCVQQRFYYGVFIIDAYTRKIVGFKVSQSMRAIANVEALAMALSCNKAPEIHHSDRGSQYGSKKYIGLLEGQKTKISMGLKAQENAYAERINRTIKEEYLDHWMPQSFQQLKSRVTKAVYHYNNKRPHKSLMRMTPTEFENKWANDPAFNKPVFTIFDNNNL